MKTIEENTTKATYWEAPFKYLPHQSEEIVQNWYKARAYVLSMLKDQLDPSVSRPKRWHFIVNGDSALMLSVVRHLALYAHFIHSEENTTITIVSQKRAAEIEAELKKEEYLCNLPDYCPLTIYDKAKNPDSYLDLNLDIALEVVKKYSGDAYVITEEKVLSWIADQKQEDIFHIDTRKAIYASETYNLGARIDNILYEDINSAKRYSKALDAFKYNVLENKKIKLQLIDKDKWESDIFAVKCGLSNVFCADCFELREAEITYLARKEEKSEYETRLTHIGELAHCEHNRWMVEKLILGYKPLGKDEIFTYEHLFGKQRKAYLKNLKTKESSPMHLDICSNKDLRRIDPDNMKYDSFLMLAMPMILAAVTKA